MVCTRKNKRTRLQRPPRIFIGEKKVKIQQEIKYLGIYFDEKLNWHTHVKNICHHMEKKVNLLNWITSKTWGLNYTNTKFIYKAAVEPALLYAVQVWHEALNNVHMRRKLTSIQRKYLIKINRAYNTAPTSALQVLANLPPVHLQAKQLIWYWYLTTKNNQMGNHPPEDDDINFNIIESNTHIDRHNNNYGIDRKLKKDKNNYHPADTINFTIQWDGESDSNYKAKWIIYTDGAKNKYGTGAGFTIKNSDNKTHYQCYYKLSHHCTNAQAEVWAILKALQYIINNQDIHKGSICILTDSKTALHCLNNTSNPTLLTHCLLTTAKALGNICNLKFAWVPAHSGVDGNEMADKLAKLGANTDIPPSFTDIPQRILKQLINLVNTIWQRDWEKADTGRNCFLFIPTIDIRTKARYFIPNKPITQVLTGHGNFPSYLCRFGLKDTDKCSCSNNISGDAIHFAFSCQTYDDQRATLMKNYLLNNSSWPPNPAKIFQNKDLWKDFTDYINKTGALIEHYTGGNNTVSDYQTNEETEEDDTDRDTLDEDDLD
ncbi:uncharacterized protein LOC111631159 [Centruroides sculpturatus]|uniref:uncharacterized protein LOC111631159 n=1 Tax=Centruroides sculpturatus TaxID=218467 RepID=UPI000C6CC62E|nr:uncharacterized protein LOC111631159 [Centruroides sculpturatus]